MKGLMGLVVLFSAVLMLAGVSFAGVAPIDPGDVGSPECREVQIAAQEEVDAMQPTGRRNWYGKVVSTAAHVVGPNVDSGYITEECASCIISQFARRVPIAEMESCGDEEVGCTRDEDCDDGVFCNGTETCVDGQCVAVSACPPSIIDVCVIRNNSCDEGLRQCVDFADDSLCPDDGNACTTESCDLATASCVSTNNTDTCDDGDACTDPDTCSGGSCGGSSVDCNDGNVCTTDSCDSVLGCQNTPIPDCCNSDADCNDGDVCTEDICSGPGGVCWHDPIPGCESCTTNEECDDGNVCTNDRCEAGTCVNENNTDPCDDGNACTTADTCSGGSCQGGSPLVCDDGNICNGQETCDQVLGCQDGTPLVCDDGLGCTDDPCDPVTGCLDPVFNDDNCPDDGLFCNEEICTTLDCITRNPCLEPGLEMCDEANRECVECLTDTDCDDSNACTTDTCVEGACQNEEDVVCPDDDLFCTGIEFCNPAIGCTSAGDPCIELPETPVCDDVEDGCYPDVNGLKLQQNHFYEEMYAKVVNWVSDSLSKLL